MSMNESLRNLPSVNDTLNLPEVAAFVEKHGREVVTYAVRRAIDRARETVLGGGEAPDAGRIAAAAGRTVAGICEPSLKPVINATGVVLHTNLGRAPLGEEAVEEIARIARGYSSLEFDLTKGKRGNRHVHAREMVTFLTGAEDALVVNNNAAGIVLLLRTLAEGREVIVSRGELIEIGGSFRIPEIMASSGARMVEVGSTNRTRLSDYESAITDETAIIFKAHKSNYTIGGFSEEVSVGELAGLAHDRGLIMVYDIGSGLLRNVEGSCLADEPDVRSALADGADLVAFSGDKLLGGPQAGIVAGKRDLVGRLASAPLMRALRVGKLTLAGLSAACRQYLNPEGLSAGNPIVGMLARSREELERLASKLAAELEKAGVSSLAVESKGQPGGGSLPEVRLESVAVEVTPQGDEGTGKQTFAERVFRELLEGDGPVLAVLREGKLLFDVLTLREDEIVPLARKVAEVCGKGANR